LIFFKAIKNLVEISLALNLVGAIASAFKIDDLLQQY
jgi:hypothetical protein